MLKIFSRWTQSLAARADMPSTPIWLRDPLAHPDIRTMDARTLGDLPIGLYRTRDLAECHNRPA